MPGQAGRRSWAILAIAMLTWSVTGISNAQTVILVRHAEKATEPRDDPGLTDVGAARADLLAQALRYARVSAIVTSPLRRTRDTAAPLAAQAGVPPVVISIGRDVGAHVAAIVVLIRKARTSDTVLVVGHSNTIPLIAAALGGPATIGIPDCAYDRMIVMRLGKASPATILSHYGPSSDQCPAEMQAPANSPAR